MRGLSVRRSLAAVAMHALVAVLNAGGDDPSIFLGLNWCIVPSRSFNALGVELEMEMPHYSY